MTYTREKLFPQSEQTKGRSLVWERRWRVKCSARLNTAPQSEHCTAGAGVVPGRGSATITSLIVTPSSAMVPSLDLPSHRISEEMVLLVAGYTEEVPGPDPAVKRGWVGPTGLAAIGRAGVEGWGITGCRRNAGLLRIGRQDFDSKLGFPPGGFVVPIIAPEAVKVTRVPC